MNSEEIKLDTVRTDCDCCKLADGEQAADYGCGERKAVFTLREQEVLKRIREAHERASELKERMRLIKGEEPAEQRAKADLKQELEALRRLRAELEAERVAAAQERMQLLGHA